MIEVDRLMKEAKARELLHRHHASSRPLSQGYEFVGLCGEAFWSDVVGIPLDWVRRPGGDGGKDFPLPDGRRLDVKAARKPYYLLVEEGKARADLYVLVRFIDEGSRVEPIGWTFLHAVLKAPVMTWNTNIPIPSHSIPANQLNPIEILVREIRELFAMKERG